MASYPSHFILPDLFADWPFESEPNPKANIIADSEHWMETFQVLLPDAQTVFNTHKFGLLAAYFYPQFRDAQFRVGCDLMNVFFLFEVFSDGRTSEEVSKLSETYMDALRYPHTEPQGSERSVIGAIVRSYWKRALEFSSTSAAERFISHFNTFTIAVRQEAWDRECNFLRSIDDYMHLRRQTIGVYPCIDLFLCNVDIPEDYISHPTIKKLEQCTIDMILLGNDIYSWNAEQASNNDQHNLVTRIMRQMRLSLQEAMDHVGNMYATVRNEFTASFDDLPSMDPKYDPIIKDYCRSLGNMVTGNHMWSHLSARYFGSDGVDVLQTRRAEVRQQ